MEAWVHRALARWPNVPALYGWLGLDRRGRWLIRGETISRPQIIDTLNRNYACDAQGAWFFQNGPQRGYVTLATAPMVLGAVDEQLSTHTGLAVTAPRSAWLDEEGSLLVDTEHGAGQLRDDDLAWALARLLDDTGRPADDAAVERALAQVDGQHTGLHLQLAGSRLPLTRVDRARAPARLGFVRAPQPQDGLSRSA